MKIGTELKVELTEALKKPVDYIEGEEAAVAIWNAALEKAMVEIHKSTIHKWDKEKLIRDIDRFRK